MNAEPPVRKRLGPALLFGSESAHRIGVGAPACRNPRGDERGGGKDRKRSGKKERVRGIHVEG